MMHRVLTIAVMVAEDFFVSVPDNAPHLDSISQPVLAVDFGSSCWFAV